MVVFIGICVVGPIIWLLAWVLAKVAAKVPPIPTVDIQKEEEKK